MAILTDGTISLRPPQLGDAPAIVSAVQVSLPELEPWMPWASEAYDESSALAWIEGAAAENHPFVIIDGDGTLVGSCGINGIDDVNRRANVGYWVRSDRTGRGVATSATRMVATHGIEELGLFRLEIVMAVGNTASRRVAERAGATYEGVLRSRLLLHGERHDAHCFSVTSRDQLM